MVESAQAPSLEVQKARVIAASKFARENFERYPELLGELIESGDLERSYPEDHYSVFLLELLAGCDDGDELARRLRRFRRREMLRILWRDFNRLVPTMETTRDTSLLAEACVQQAQAWWHESLVGDYGEPRNAAGDLGS